LGTGAIAWHIKGKGDMEISRSGWSGNVSANLSRLVPPPPIVSQRSPPTADFFTLPVAALARRKNPRADMPRKKFFLEHHTPRIPAHEAAPRRQRWNAPDRAKQRVGGELSASGRIVA
jgi:hypothetical protein